MSVYAYSMSRARGAACASLACAGGGACEAEEHARRRSGRAGAPTPRRARRHTAGTPCTSLGQRNLGEVGLRCSTLVYLYLRTEVSS